LAGVSRVGYYRHWHASAPRQEETAVRDEMAKSIARLAAAGHSVAAAWEKLGEGGRTVAGLLQETVSRIHAHEEISQVLRKAASELTSTVPAGSDDFDKVSSEAEKLLEVIRHSYTMEAERAVFARHVPAYLSGKLADGQTAPDADLEADAIEEVFF